MSFSRSIFFPIGFILLLFTFLLPRIILGEDSYVTIHDNLDNEFIWRLMLTENGRLVGDDAIIKRVMNGLSAKTFPSQWNITVWLFLILDPFKAYVANEIIIRCIAYIGMFLLLNKFLLPQTINQVWKVFIAFTFAALPFYSIYGLAIAGQPLLLYAFLKLKNGNHSFSSYLIIVVFAFYSSLPLIGFFILVTITIGGIIYIFQFKKIPVPFLVGYFLLIISYALTEHNLLYLMFFDKSFISHRVSFDAGFVICQDIKKVVEEAADNFVFGYYHVASVHRPIILSAIIALVACWRKRDLKYYEYIILLLVLAFIFSCFYSIYNSYLFTDIKNTILIIKTFNFSRFYWLHPLIWYIIFSLSIFSIIRHYRWGKGIAAGLITLQVLFNLKSTTEASNEFYINVGLLIDKFKGDTKAGERTPGLLTYRRFYSEKLFKKIKEHIGKPQEQYRVASIGLHPSIAQYNGFYTLDGYQNNYPLEYKVRFRKVIQGELEKNDNLKDYYEGWGNRFYLFVSDLNNNNDIEEINPSLNIEAFKSMGGEYIFSSVKIGNAEDNGLLLDYIFEASDSTRRVYLYYAL